MGLRKMDYKNPLKFYLHFSFRCDTLFKIYKEQAGDKIMTCINNVYSILIMLVLQIFHITVKA